MVRKHYEYAIAQIQSEKDKAIAQARETATREKVIPHNNEVNASRDKAIAELNAKLNEDIAALQQKFASERQSLIEMGEKNKTDYANSVIASEVAMVTVTYDQAINDLTNLLNKIKE
jgi:hypothetical protein